MIPTLANPIVEEFRALEEHCLNLAVAGEFEALVTLLDVRFTAITYHGATYNRDTYARVLRSATRYERASLGPIEVSVEGTIAIVSGKMDVDLKRDGFSISGPIRFTRIWSKHADGWRVLHVHVSDARLGEAWLNARNKSKS